MRLCTNKACTVGLPQNESEFYETGYGDRRMTHCKTCVKARSRAWKAAHRKLVNERERVRQRQGERVLYSHLTAKEKEFIHANYPDMSMGQIARRINRSRSAVSRELARRTA